MFLCCYDISQSKPYSLQTLIQILENGKNLISEMYVNMGFDKLLLCPPNDNARNIIDFVLLDKCVKVRNCGESCE